MHCNTAHYCSLNQGLPLFSVFHFQTTILSKTSKFTMYLSWHSSFQKNFCYPMIICAQPYSPTSRLYPFLLLSTILVSLNTYSQQPRFSPGLRNISLCIVGISGQILLFIMNPGIALQMDQQSRWEWIGQPSKSINWKNTSGMAESCHLQHASLV